MTDNSRILVVDGSNYLFRSYFGVPEAANYKGVKVNAVYGFFAILRRITKSIDPQSIYVVFDSQTGIQSKIEENPEYKATRELVDTGMYVQLPMIKGVLERCGIRWIEPPYFEADDVIGLIANEFAQLGSTSYISSNDFDFAQLIAPRVVLVRDFKGQAVHITEQDFINEWGFHPSQYVDYLSLKGDSSDNVTGIAGIGPKTARDLVQRYHTVKGIVEHYSELSPRIGSKIQQNAEKLFSNSTFLKIRSEIDFILGEQGSESSQFIPEMLFSAKTNDHLAALGIEG